MNRRLLDLFFVLIMASPTFAAWNIECVGPKGSALFFTKMSFSGEPIVMFRSPKSYFQLQGDQQITHMTTTDGQTRVSATRPDLAQIVFKIPFSVPGDGFLTHDLSFDMTVNVGEQMPMYCIAKNVVFGL